MIEEWQPAPQNRDTQPDVALLVRFAAAAEAFANTGNCDIDEQDLNRAAGWLKIKEAEWYDSLVDLDEAQLFDLAIFFTVAEQKLSGFQSGARNPAIWACRLLKQMGKTPAKERIRHLKSLTDNRYIPWGKVI
ncbi:hypothetical protein [Parathalassolituus penaei]|uniref:Uncharacterized protein n=1 Tax=Parathalassolituus penaei TaxID=2997323 RepID=A0A9X3EH83_9GAMM|nr:hypothetical protein [Parathalassolituus penaei]MCY0967136.1 hypothetical protein [Parathalassolituus penaei]